MWAIGVEVEQETSAPPPKKKFYIRPCNANVLLQKTFYLQNSFSLHFKLRVMYVFFVQNVQ